MNIKNVFGDESSFTSMSPTDRAYFMKILEEESKRRYAESHPIQVREIVPIEKWVESEYYVGPDVVNIYDYWKDFVRDIFRSDRTNENKISQVILSGALGIGKSTVAELIMLRKLYEMSCWKNINSMFGLMAKTSIIFLYFSVNKTQAERTGFGEIRSWIDSSPYFREKFPRNQRLKEALVFPESLMFIYGSGSQHSIGMSVIGTILDEANFRGTGDAAHSGAGDAGKAGDLYSGILNRAASRFVLEGGVNHSLNILISSSTFESSFTESQIVKCKNDPHTLIANPSQWEVKPKKFSSKRFWVCKGSELLEPYIAESVEDVSRFRLAEGLKRCGSDESSGGFEDIKGEVEKLPPHMADKFIAVPEDLRLNFTTNILKSLQDLAGVSIGSFGKLFTSVTVYRDCIDERMFHPFIQESVTVATGDPIEISSFLKRGIKFRHPERPRYMHIDQSTTTDCTGISSVYIEEIYEEGGVRKTKIGVDFMLRIVPPKPPKKIAIYKIRNFVLYLNKVMGIKFGKVTYDIFNSEESRQILEEAGINVGYQSVDRTDKAYLDMVTLMYENRLLLYDYNPFKRELFNLLHDRAHRKVDHPKTNDTADPDSGSGVGSVGTKDVADSLCGAVENALSDTLDVNVPTTGSVNDFLTANGHYTHTNIVYVEDMIDREIEELLNSLD